MDFEIKATAQTKTFQEEWAKLQQTLQLGLIDTSTLAGAEKKRIAEIELQFAETAMHIQKLGEQLGLSQEEIAKRIADAWKISLREITSAADRANEEQFNKLFGSLDIGIRDTLRGISEGTQSLGDGMRNLARNMMLSFQEELLKETLLNPLKDMLMSLFRGIRSGHGGLFSGLFSGIGSLFGFEQGGLVPAFAAFANGGLVSGLPRFDNGGLAVVHPGEFVLRAPSVRTLGAGNVTHMNQTGQLPGRSGAPRIGIEVIVNGSITPNDRNARQNEIIQVVARDLDNRGLTMRTFEQRTSIRGR